MLKRIILLLKELQVIAFALDNFHQYLMCSKVIVYIDHAALKHSLAKNDPNSRLIE